MAKAERLRQMSRVLEEKARFNSVSATLKANPSLVIRIEEELIRDGIMTVDKADTANKSGRCKPNDDKDSDEKREPPVLALDDAASAEVSRERREKFGEETVLTIASLSTEAYGKKHSEVRFHRC